MAAAVLVLYRKGTAVAHRFRVEVFCAVSCFCDFDRVLLPATCTALHPVTSTTSAPTCAGAGSGRRRTRALALTDAAAPATWLPWAWLASGAPCCRARRSGMSTGGHPRAGRVAGCCQQRRRPPSLRRLEFRRMH